MVALLKWTKIAVSVVGFGTIFPNAIMDFRLDQTKVPKN